MEYFTAKSVFKDLSQNVERRTKVLAIASSLFQQPPPKPTVFGQVPEQVGKSVDNQKIIEMISTRFKSP
jgi:hypothetical protein